MSRMFDDTPFDLNAYFARIAYTGDRKPTLQTLQAIAFRHPASIPFENLDALLRRPIALDSISLQRKLVHSRRGGWCFEHNLLLGHALTAIGFDVTGLAARVLWDAPAGIVRPRSHMVLRVRLRSQAASAGHVGEDDYLLDSGFGGLTLTGVLRFVPGIEQETPHEPFLISASRPGGETAGNPRHATDVFLMQAKVRGEWKSLYTFDTQPQARADYEVSNWYLCNHPGSHFLSTLVAARADAGCRYALRNGELAVHHRNGATERTTLTSADEIRRVLDERFHIDVPAGADVDAGLERLLPAHT